MDSQADRVSGGLSEVGSVRDGIQHRKQGVDKRKVDRDEVCWTNIGCMKHQESHNQVNKASQNYV